MASADRALVEWLRAQLDAHESEARTLLGDAQEFRQQLRETRLLGTEQVGHYRWVDVERMATGVLADVAAKRAVLDALTPWIDGPNAWPVDPRSVAVERAVRALAAAYADRPGYREEWRPDVSAQAVCTFESGRWRRMLQRGELDGSPVGMLVDVVDRDTDDVQRLVLTDDGWVSVDR